MTEALTVLLVVGIALVKTGSWDWTKMAVTFLVRQKGGRPRLAALELKLAVLRVLLRVISRTERRLPKGGR
ncbi:MAG: hypothetical protein M3198_13320 [Actinomycetota bacterium]|nr:hypothetical protein [Actinomycetota bacterium]